MNLTFKTDVWKGNFRPTLEAETFEERLRPKLGLAHKYESAQLSIGRSLAERSAPPPLPLGIERGRAIPGELLFGDAIDVWMSALIMDGQLGNQANVDDFRALVECHWARGWRLLSEELEECHNDEARFIARLAELLPTSEGAVAALAVGASGEIRVTVGSVSRSFSTKKPIDFVINGPGSAPHIALMGKNGSGKTMTGVQIALDIVRKAKIPFLFIDPKGEFVDNGRVIGGLGESLLPINAIEVGQQPIALDLLPDPGIGSASITKAAMQFRDSLALCCKGAGDIQKDLLRTAVENVIRHERPRDLSAVRDWYKQELDREGKKHDSIMSMLNELTQLRLFAPGKTPSEFFGQSWVLSLKALGSEALKRLTILFLLDTLRTNVLSQTESPIVGGFRSLRHLLVIDEARRILADAKCESLVDLVRQGRSKGEVVILLSQDPSDFEGQADDFTTQLGTVIGFACSQSSRGLRALQGAYMRKLQANEFSDSFLPPGVAFAKLPQRDPERIHCWGTFEGTGGK